MIRNSRANLLTRMQEWDYFLGIAAVKRMQGLYQSTLVAQGAFSLYRTDELRRVGGWPDAIGEDIVVTWRLMETGDRVLTEPTAIAFTDAPTQVTHFMRQRARWARGMVEAIRTVPPWRQRRVLSRFVAGIDLLIPLLDIGYGLDLGSGPRARGVRLPDHRRHLDARGPADHAPRLRRAAALPTAPDLRAAAAQGAPQPARLHRVHPRLPAAVLGGFAGRLRAGDRAAPAAAGSSGTVDAACRSRPSASACKPASTPIRARGSISPGRPKTRLLRALRRRPSRRDRVAVRGADRGRGSAYVDPEASAPTCSTPASRDPLVDRERRRHRRRALERALHPRARCRAHAGGMGDDRSRLPDRGATGRATRRDGRRRDEVVGRRGRDAPRPVPTRRRRVPPDAAAGAGRDSVVDRRQRRAGAPARRARRRHREPERAGPDVGRRASSRGRLERRRRSTGASRMYAAPRRTRSDRSSTRSCSTSRSPSTA